jgi:DNA excision repair protein ERCC-2
MVEYLLRGGDLRYDFFGAVGAAEGVRVHQRIQRRRPAAYKAEVPVTFTAEREQFRLCVNGRIDGVWVEPCRTVIEEIKTTRRPLDELAQNPDPIHWGQAQCYAYMWAAQEKTTAVVVRLTYVNPDSGKTRELERSLDMAVLAPFFNDLVDRYIQWTGRLAHWAKARDQSIENLAFPFEAYRDGQRDMAVAVFRTIREKGHLLVQAATGIGKTMAALFPAVKALGAKLTAMVVFLTARTTGRLAAESALRMLMDQGLRIKAVTLTAKDKICFNPQSACTPEECRCARGYFDRINAALGEALAFDALTRARIEEVALAYSVCPFEFSLELVNWADCVICDYNYAFAPGVMLQRLFEERSGRPAMLVDEAHNLVDRSREMFSAQLAKQPVLALRRQVKKELPGVHNALGRINTWMVAARRRCLQADQVLVDNELPEVLLDHLGQFLRAAEKWLALNDKAPFKDALVELYFKVAGFMRVAEAFDEHYTVIYEISDGELRIRLFCIDPSHQLRQAWRRCGSAILFSATLTPAGYFQSVLGCSDKAAMLNLSSPFPPSNLAVFIADHISTFFRKRLHSMRSVTGTIADLVRQRTGNYLVYFPSFQYMQMVYEQFTGQCRDLETVIQTPEMGERERLQFLSRFQNDVSQTLVGFAVMGGIFGEGIDLKGERLSGAVIVGVGLPGICLERDLIKAYYDRVLGCGFEFAYQYPGIHRVLQAAGRVIRSEKDQGLVLLIDRRYGHRHYRALLPGHWHLQTSGDRMRFIHQIRSFWKA